MMYKIEYAVEQDLIFKFNIMISLTDYMRKTQICVRAALAIQHVLHDIASGSVLRIDSRKRVIVTNRFFAKVK